MNDSKAIAIIGAALVLVIAGGAWWMLSRREAPASNATPRAVMATEAPIEKPAPPPVNLPPLDQMDGFLRPLLAALSTRPELARWLATDDLIRQIAAAIDRASTGASPARDFRLIAPAGKFTVGRRGTTRIIDPANYRRYSGLVATINSIDPETVATIYQTIRPRLNEAYRAMGNPGRDVDAALQLVLDTLLDTPLVSDPIAIVEGEGARWNFADPDVEALVPIQKQLLRMGPAHADTLLVWLQSFRAALQ
jgi:hypothetical protein